MSRHGTRAISGRALMYSVNRRGPRTLPCGNPRLHVVSSLREPATLTCCDDKQTVQQEESVTKIADEPLKSLVFQSYVS